MSARIVSLVAAAVVALAIGCNEVPVGGIGNSYVVDIKAVRERSQPAKLDILWVVDDSPSMCQEQQSLAASFSTFLKTFQKYTAIDMQLAVTTTNVCPKDKPNVRGRFIYQPADESTISPECVEKRVMPCLKHTDGTDDCQTNPSLPDKEHWVCEAKEAKYIYSCDKPKGYGTDKYPGDVLFVVNTMCRYSCDVEKAPEACALTFGEPSSCTSACSSGTFDQSKCPDPADVISCQNVGQTNWKCYEKCKAYLHDAAKCEKVCSSQDCFATCTYPGDKNNNYAGKNFPKQDFLCALACDDNYDCDARCIAEFGKPTYRCLYPGGDKGRAGCLLPPATQYCPPKDKGPKVLTKGDPGCCIYAPDSPEFQDNCLTGTVDGSVTCTWFKAWKKGEWSGDPDWAGMSDTVVYDKVFEQLFTCMATVATGATQTPCANQEQGLEAAWKALDPAGENAEQAKAFHRPDAYLLIVIVSDEEDCSSVEGGVKAEQYSICGCLTDQNGCKADGTCGFSPGPLIPPEVYVNRFKSLKPDPAMVVFAVITGDVIPGSPTSPVLDEDQIRKRYYECKCPEAQTMYSPLTYACLSNQGKADLGYRYKRVARAFGPGWGQFSNICDDRGLAPALENIARLVLPLLTNICLPRPITSDENLTVYKLVDGKRVEMQPSTETEKKDYRLVKIAVCGTFEGMNPGDRLENAIIFEEPLEYGEQVVLDYSGKPFYGQ